MITDTSDRILNYIRTNKQAKAVDLIRDIGITNASIHRQLNKLIGEEKLIKVGKPPIVFYILKEKEKRIDIYIQEDIKDFINKNYIYVSPVGEYISY